MPRGGPWKPEPELLHVGCTTTDSNWDNYCVLVDALLDHEGLHLGHVLDPDFELDHLCLGTSCLPFPSISAIPASHDRAALGAARCAAEDCASGGRGVQQRPLASSSGIKSSRRRGIASPAWPSVVARVLVHVRRHEQADRVVAAQGTDGAAVVPGD